MISKCPSYGGGAPYIYIYNLCKLAVRENAQDVCVWERLRKTDCKMVVRKRKCDGPVGRVAKKHAELCEIVGCEKHSKGSSKSITKQNLRGGPQRQPHHQTLSERKDQLQNARRERDLPFAPKNHRTTAGCPRRQAQLYLEEARSSAKRMIREPIASFATKHNRSAFTTQQILQERPDQRKMQYRKISGRKICGKKLREGPRPQHHHKTL